MKLIQTSTNKTIVHCFLLSALISIFFYTTRVYADNHLTTSSQNTSKAEIFLFSATAMRYNPAGLETQNRIMYSQPIFNDNSLLLKNAYVATGITTKLSPAHLKVGAIIDVQPIAVCNIKAGYEYITYFGTRGYVQSYPFADKTVDFDDKTRKANENNAYATNGHYYFLEPTVQMLYKKFAARTKFLFSYFDIHLKNNDTYFYEAAYDTLVPIKKMVWSSDSDLLYIYDTIACGIRYSTVSPRNQLGHKRIGPLFAWQFTTADSSTFHKPTAFIIVNWYLTHPNRHGVKPYVLAGIFFTYNIINTYRGTDQ